jgi:hypothetical protein
MSSFERFTRAATDSLIDLDAESVTREIDQVINSLHATDDSTSLAIRVGHRLVDNLSREW